LNYSVELVKFELTAAHVTGLMPYLVVFAMCVY